MFFVRVQRKRRIQLWLPLEETETGFQFSTVNVDGNEGPCMRTAPAMMLLVGRTIKPNAKALKSFISDLRTSDPSRRRSRELIHIPLRKTEPMGSGIGRRFFFGGVLASYRNSWRRVHSGGNWVVTSRGRKLSSL